MTSSLSITLRHFRPGKGYHAEIDDRIFLSYLNVDRMCTNLLPVFLPTQYFVLSSKLNLLSLLKLAKTYILFR